MWRNQTTQIAKKKYVGSPLQKRNEKIRRAARIAPVRKGEAGCEQFAELRHVMTAADLVANGDTVEVQVSACREPYLLVRDCCNPGHFLPVAIHDIAVEQEERSGLYELELHSGPVLVKPDTLIYWK